MATFNVIQEGPVNALALNRDNTQVAIGGRNVFKVYAIEEDKFREVCNLRASKHLNLSFSCNDVAWSSTDDSYLATAATNGHVCVWNLTKMGKAMQEQDYQDHKRTVNKVNFHASEPSKLISGSQDGTMRYFDLRVKSAVSIFYSNTESVRDVQFSPHNPYTFSAVSDNGSVQLWDIRKSEKCLLQYTAHSGPVFACDWHPESTWLATASRDKTIKVWDLTNKPTLEYTIHTIASIGHVKWRPQRKFHIASCALVIDCSINIWDVRRPYIPFASFNEHRDIASGVAWRGDPHIFLSSGRDCMLTHHSFNEALRPASKANPQALSLNRMGEVLHVRKVSTLSNNSNSNNALAKATAGIIRKISTTQCTNQFHQTTSIVQQFKNISWIQKQESDTFLALANNYVLHGRSVSEMCEHNSAVAREFGKPEISSVWKIIKTMYGEEFVQNSINIPTSSRDDSSHSNLPINSIGPSVISMDNAMSNIRVTDVDPDQKSKGGDTPGAQFSGGDDETENEDQMDHQVCNNAFPTYLNFRTGLPKGDFTFGENELDMEIDSLNADFRTPFRGYNHIIPTFQQDWTLPTEAFPIRQEILERASPPRQLPNHHHSPDIHEESHTFQFDDQPPALISVTKTLRMPLWDPSNIVIESLKHHATLGDVQTSACILIVLGESRKYLKGLCESLQEHWLLGYIELLARYKLWNVATQVIKLSWLSSVFQLNQQSTRFNTNCSDCTKPLQRAGWLCDRCHTSSYALCSFCHQVVRGLYVWCQGCSHGGHLVHMKQWFSTNKVCPTGCGHACEYK